MAATYVYPDPETLSSNSQPYPADPEGKWGGLGLRPASQSSAVPKSPAPAPAPATAQEVRATPTPVITQRNITRDDSIDHYLIYQDLGRFGPANVGGSGTLIGNIRRHGGSIDELDQYIRQLNSLMTTNSNGYPSQPSSSYNSPYSPVLFGSGYINGIMSAPPQIWSRSQPPSINGYQDYVAPPPHSNPRLEHLPSPRLPSPQQSYQHPLHSLSVPNPQQNNQYPHHGLSVPNPQQNNQHPYHGLSVPNPLQNNQHPDHGLSVPNPLQNNQHPRYGLHAPGPQQSYQEPNEAAGYNYGVNEQAYIANGDSYLASASTQPSNPFLSADPHHTNQYMPLQPLGSINRKHYRDGSGDEVGHMNPSFGNGQSSGQFRENRNGRSSYAQPPPSTPYTFDGPASALPPKRRIPRQSPRQGNPSKRVKVAPDPIQDPSWHLRDPPYKKGTPGVHQPHNQQRIPQQAQDMLNNYLQSGRLPTGYYFPVVIDRRETRSRLYRTAYDPLNANPCKYCGKNAFLNRDEFQQHIDRHEYEWVCDQERCAKRLAIFPTWYKLNQHRMEQHTDHYQGKAFTFSGFCPADGCIQHFIQKAELEAHVKRRHPDLYSR